jgi:hypothetical protein
VRSVFAGTPAYLGRIDSETRCAFWPHDPSEHDFDPAGLIEVDLAFTPEAAVAKEIDWGEVQVDDCYAGPNGVVHGTTLGPSWPEFRLSGVVYLEQGYVRSLPERLRPPCPPRGMAGYAYECMSTAYWPDTDDPRAGRRYAGHHAEITDERGGVARLAVYPPGRSKQPGVQPMTMWLDLSSPEQCDAGPRSLTTIGTGDAPKRGAVFLISGELSDGT